MLQPGTTPPPAHPPPGLPRHIRLLLTHGVKAVRLHLHKTSTFPPVKVRVREGVLPLVPAEPRPDTPVALPRSGGGAEFATDETQTPRHWVASSDLLEGWRWL